MSAITRGRDAAYWNHSNPDTPDDEPAVPDLPGYLDVATTACPGPCNRTWRGSRRHPGLHAKAMSEYATQAGTADEDEPYDPDPTVIRAAIDAITVGTPVWCRACADQIYLDFARLPALATACGARRDGHLAPPPPSDRNGTRIAPPSPSPAWDQVAVIVEWAAAWADSLSRHLSGADPAFYLTTGIPARTLTRSSRYLQGHCSAALSGPMAADIGVELFDLIYRSEKLAGVDELVHPLPLPCVQCGRKALRRRDGAERVECTGCRSTWAWEDYERLGVQYRAVTEREASA